MPPRTILRKPLNAREGKGSKQPAKSGAGGRSPNNDKNRPNPNQILKNRPTIATPKSDIINDFGIRRSIPSVYSLNEYGVIEELPPLSSVPEEKFNDMMRQKLQQCRIICNFADPMADLKSKDIKRSYLTEILEHISQASYFRMMETETFAALFAMVKTNIIRAIPPLPPLAKVPYVGDDINDTIYESAWPHLEYVYQIFQRTLESPILKTNDLVQFIDQSFIYQFLELFNTSDQRERDSLKMVLHRLYLRFVQQRSLIRQSIQNIFLTYIYETRYFTGINELLEIMISIINGYAVPLKQEHKDFLVQTLLPLHTSYFLHLFHPNLFICINHYIKKDISLIPVIVRSLIDLWPKSNSWKELIFIGELGRILEQMPEDQFVDLKAEMFHKIGQCITSNNYQVSENGMLLWKIDRFVQMTSVYADDLYPIICPYLHKTGTNHWNPPNKNLAVSVIRICMESSRNAFETFSTNMKDLTQKRIKQTAKEKEMWETIQDSANIHFPEIQIRQYPHDIETTYSMGG